MPIITISHKETASPTELAKTLQALPEIVSRAVECPEEPYDGELKPGDVNMIVTASLALSDGLDYVIEIKTRRTDSRLRNLDERVGEIRSALGALGLQNFGVWLELHDASWAQTDYRTAGGHGSAG
jgi:hypothetical protein